MLNKFRKTIFIYIKEVRTKVILVLPHVILSLWFAIKHPGDSGDSFRSLKTEFSDTE